MSVSLHLVVTLMKGDPNPGSLSKPTEEAIPGVTGAKSK